MEETVKKRGGGPKTDAGKAVARMNPVKHAVLAQTPVIPLIEREEDWEQLRSGVFEYLKVEGALEEALADRIAGLIWRLYRVVRFESESINRYLHDVPGDYWMMRSFRSKDAGDGEEKEVTARDVERMDEMLMARLLPGEETAEKIQRYETKLHRLMLQTLRQLLVLKALRKAPERIGEVAGLHPLALGPRREMR